MRTAVLIENTEQRHFKNYREAWETRRGSKKSYDGRDESFYCALKAPLEFQPLEARTRGGCLGVKGPASWCLFWVGGLAPTAARGLICVLDVAPFANS